MSEYEREKRVSFHHEEEEKEEDGEQQVKGDSEEGDGSEAEEA